MAVVSVRSSTYSTRFSSAIRPPSPLSGWLRLNPVATSCSGVVPGTRSPASWSMVNLLKGRLSLNALITHSRHGHITRVPSPWYPLVSA